MIILPKGLRGVLKLVAVDLRGERIEAKFRTIDRCVNFAHKYQLVKEEQETELVEMLVAGARFEDAVAELRPVAAARAEPSVAGPGPPFPTSGAKMLGADRVIPTERARDGAEA
jgi:predicted DNA-binding antitoxin AbrB/MazE fold protein